MMMMMMMKCFFVCCTHFRTCSHSSLNKAPPRARALFLREKALKSNALRRAVGLPLLGEKHVPTLYKEMQEELARKQKAGGAMGGGGGGAGAGAGAGAGVMTEEARELMNKREMQARKLVEGYKPVSAGAFRQE